MRRRFTLTLTAGTLAALTGVAGLAATAHSGELPPQNTRLTAKNDLPAASFRADTPGSGQQFTSTDRGNAQANGIGDGTPATGAYLADQPVQGFSSMVPAGDGTWWALADNGYGTRASSPDFQLAIYRIDPRFGSSEKSKVLETVVLSDPNDKVPWTTICDPTGDALPPFSFNQLIAVPAEVCGPSGKVLTGFDFDPESLAIGPDGSFWIGEEFGPFLLKVNRAGELLAAPFAAPGLKSPQNPTLRITDSDEAKREQPTVPQSRGFEGLAISPDRRTLYPLLEGAVGTDDAQTVRLLEFDVRREQFTDNVRKIRLEMPGAKVNLAALVYDAANGGGRVYPSAPALDPATVGGQSAAEATAVNRDRLLIIERDGAGDAVTPDPRFKKVFAVELGNARGGYLTKTALVDLMAVPDPDHLGGDGTFFRFPFNTIESVHVVDDRTILVSNDNNLPFSNARARSTTLARTTLGADANEMILVQVGTRLGVDNRLLHPPH